MNVRALGPTILQIIFIAMQQTIPYHSSVKWSNLTVDDSLGSHKNM